MSFTFDKIHITYVTRICITNIKIGAAAQFRYGKTNKHI